MRRRLTIIAAVLIFLVGFAVFAYPTVSNWLAQEAMLTQVNDYERTVSTFSEEDLSMYWDQARAYNERLTGLADGEGSTEDAGLAFNALRASASESLSDEYQAALNLNGDGLMAEVFIPKVDIEAPVYHGTEDETLQKGSGHLEGSTLPVGGRSRHCVLTGHTGLPAVQVFDRIDQLEVGDWFIVRTLKTDLAYRVYGTEVVLPEEVSSLTVEPGRDLVTLVTCTPYGVNTHRLLVHAERCEVPQEWLDRVATSKNAPFFAQHTPSRPKWPLLVLLGIVIGVCLVIAKVLHSRRRARKALAASGASRPGYGRHSRHRGGRDAGRR